MLLGEQRLQSAASARSSVPILGLEGSRIFKNLKRLVNSATLPRWVQITLLREIRNSADRASATLAEAGLIWVL